MEKELYDLLREFVAEYLPRQNELLTNNKFYYAIKKGKHAQRGTKRADNGGNIEEGISLNLSIMHIIFSEILAKFKTPEKVFNFLSDHEIWFGNYESYERSLSIWPSAMGGFLGGFLCRIFEINHHLFIITDESFDIAFKELIVFINKSTINYDTYIHLIGVTGEIAEVELAENVSIVKADYFLSRDFSINYTPNEINHSISNFEGDYLLKIKFEFPKSHYNVLTNTAAREEAYILKKWLYLPVLGLPGQVKIGKRLVQSDDWTIITARAVGPFEIVDSLSNWSNTVSIDESTIPFLKEAALIIDKEIVPRVFEEKINYSIERLIKSKEAGNIDDRIVDLAIAWEYLFSTNPQQLVVQLTLQIIKLIYPQNENLKISKDLRKFYDLRSKVVHGATKVELNQTNLHLIGFAENAIQRAILQLIELTKTYTLNQIKEALAESMYLTLNLNEILSRRSI